MGLERDGVRRAIRFVAAATWSTQTPVTRRRSCERPSATWPNLRSASFRLEYFPSTIGARTVSVSTSGPMLVLYTDGLTESSRNVIEGETLLRAVLTSDEVMIRRTRQSRCDNGWSAAARMMWPS